MSNGHFDSEVETQATIPLDIKITQKLRLEHVPTDRSVSRGASPVFYSLHQRKGEFFSPRK
jgi:hypothetical protein